MRKPGLRHPGFWGFLAAAGIVSSVLGLRGWMQIWSVSAAADIVFVLGTVGAFTLTSMIPVRLWPVSVAAGFMLHWITYGLSWSLVLAAGNAQGDHFDRGAPFPFVLNVGWMGLLWCAGASPLLAWAAERLVPAPRPPPVSA